MILPHTYLASLLVGIVSTLCLALWASTYKAASKWRFELYYLDFVFGLVLAAAIFAFTVGNLGFDGFSFIDDLMHAGKREWVDGFVAGILFNFANMLIMASVAVTGMSLAFPVSMGLGLVVGLTFHEVMHKSAGAGPLFAGCGLLLAAVFAAVTAFNSALSDRRLQEMAKAANTAKTKSTSQPVSLQGAILSIVSGFVMGLSYPLIDAARVADVGMGPYSLLAMFALGAFASTFVLNLFFMNLPVQGDPIEVTAFFKGTLRQHLLGLLGGAIWCSGVLGAFVIWATPPEAQTSAAVAYAVPMAAPLLAALWGFSVCGEFKGAGGGARAKFFAMLVLFAAGIAAVSIGALNSRH